MTLAILLTRRAHLKILFGVIGAALRRGHAVTLVAQVRAAKPGDRLDVRELHRLWPDVPIRDTYPMDADAIIGPDAVLPDLKSIPLIGVDHFYDCWTYPAFRTDNYTLCYHSDYHRDVHRRLWPEQRHRSAVVGWTAADWAPHVPAWPDRDQAVFFSLKLRVPEPWRRSPAGRRAYREVYDAARARARAEGLAFVVKGRAKNGDPWWMRWGADAYVTDAEHPAMSLSLLRRAQWCVHFESGAGLEAALMGCYSIAIAVPQSHIIGLPGGALQYGGASALHDWPGVAQYGWPEGVVFTSETQRAKYLTHFVGECDGRAGERVVHIAEGGS